MLWSKRQQIENQRRMLKALDDAAYASDLETAKWLSNMQMWSIQFVIKYGYLPGKWRRNQCIKKSRRVN